MTESEPTVYCPLCRNTVKTHLDLGRGKHGKRCERCQQSFEFCGLGDNFRSAAMKPKIDNSTNGKSKPKWCPLCQDLCHSPIKTDQLLWRCNDKVCGCVFRFIQHHEIRAE